MGKKQALRPWLSVSASNPAELTVGDDKALAGAGRCVLRQKEERKPVAAAARLANVALGGER